MPEIKIHGYRKGQYIGQKTIKRASSRPAYDPFSQYKTNNPVAGMASKVSGKPIISRHPKSKPLYAKLARSAGKQVAAAKYIGHTLGVGRGKGHLTVKDIKPKTVFQRGYGVVKGHRARRLAKLEYLERVHAYKGQKAERNVQLYALKQSLPQEARTSSIKRSKKHPFGIFT